MSRSRPPKCPRGRGCGACGPTHLLRRPRLPASFDIAEQLEESRHCARCAIPTHTRCWGDASTPDHDGICCDCFDASLGAPAPWLFWPLSPEKMARRGR